jgi:iron complex transport system substrate-binding protein
MKNPKSKISILKLSIAKIGIIVFLFTARLLSAQESTPQRIISLGPSITKGLYLLGVQDELVANTVYCIDPPGARKKEKVGTAVEVNIEKVFNLKPDLVLVTTLTNPKAKEKLKNLGVRVITFFTPKDFKDIYEHFLELGRLVGKENKAKEIVRRVENGVVMIRERVKNLYKPKVLIQVGAKPLWIAPKDSFVNDFIEIAGGINVGPSGKNGLYSREQVLKRNPDVIIITTMGIVGKEEKKIWQRYKAINAVRNNRIYVVDSDKLCSPTPVSFLETLEEMVNILHPHI